MGRAARTKMRNISTCCRISDGSPKQTMGKFAHTRGGLQCVSRRGKFYGQCCPGRDRGGDAVGSKTSSEAPLCFVSAPVCPAPIHGRFVWLGLDGRLPTAGAHDAGAAFMLYAQALLPVLLPWECSCLSPWQSGDAECFRSLFWALHWGCTFCGLSQPSQARYSWRRTVSCT